MAENFASLGELELEVLKTVWACGGCSVHEAAEAVGKKRKCARTTVLTVMQRLHAKGFLKREKVNGVYRYCATEERGKVLGGLVRQFVDKVMDGSATTLVSYLAESGVSSQEIEQMRKVLDEAETGGAE